MVTLQDQTRRILIVEDDSDTAEVVCALLESAGYHAVAVDSGSLALTQLSRTLPDLVLLDINLPDINGLDILRQVRASSFLPMIILSGFNQERDKVTALEAGAD